jgi:signal transduction histidine kinase/DNA-binding response OmpR family regulator
MNDRRASNYVKWPTLLFVVLFSLSASEAQVRQTLLRLTTDSLQKDLGIYSLYSLPWQFHAGDDARWANPAMDDRNWLLYPTGFTVNDSPPDWNGIGWFRLHFTVDSSLTNQLLALRIAHVGASEIYVDGQKIGGFGVIDSTRTAGIDYFPFNESVAFRLDRPDEHVLAIRIATYHQYFTRRIAYPQGFLSWIAHNDRMTTFLISAARNNGLNLVLVFGPGLFALLHLFLFLFYPARTSNLHYSLWLIFFAGASSCVYFDNVFTDPARLQTIAYIFLLTNLAFAVASVAFIYSVCYSRQPRQIWFFCALGILLVLLLLLFPALSAPMVTLMFLSICTLEVLRVVLLGMLRQQPGVWLIGMGLLAVAVGVFIGSVDVLNLWQKNPYGQNLFITFSFLTLPLCTSLYLAQDFARTNLNLEVQLKQVNELSAKTLAQEAEKLQLVAEQNQQLEQTVLERTAQLQQKADKLREMDAVKSRFFTNLTHEFRTPLTLILGPAELVLAHTQEAKTRQQVSLLQRNAQRLLKLINQLLDLSKLEAGKMELNTAPGELVSLAKGSLFSFESLAAQKQITLRFTTSQDRLVMAIDRDKLEKIIYNLIANALKFTQVNGNVLVSITRDITDKSSWVQLSIQDTGVGIPTPKLPYIFDRFYQVDASDTREQEGTGIGLALTKELVELHGGSIQISSQEHVGTTVTVRLPILQEQLIDVVPESDPLSTVQRITSSPEPFYASPEADDTSLVLLIEDNDEVRSFIRSSLVDHYQIIEATNGEEGVRLAQQQVPDLVLTDLMMPKMDGYQVCTKLKQDERTSHIPVIMLTAKADLESKLEGLETGADSYLAKPFNQRELLAQMNNLIVLRRQLRERYSQNTLWTSAETPLPSMEQLFLDRVRAAVEAHLSDEQYSVERLSDDVGLSRTQLHRKLKALINQTPGDLLRLIRLQRALNLLRGNVGNVAEVAYMVGFGNPANFSTSFSRHFGYPPSEAKKMGRFFSLSR